MTPNKVARSQPLLALAVPLSGFTPRVGGGSASYARHRTLRAFQSLLYLFCCIVLVGCTQRVTSHRKTAVLLLDNHGGVTHGGRRIEVRADGSYMDTSYADPGAETAKNGRSTLNPERTQLVLSPDGGKTERLYRVDYDGQQYWVHEAERERITQAGEASLRQVSVRGVP